MNFLINYTYLSELILPSIKYSFDRPPTQMAPQTITLFPLIFCSLNIAWLPPISLLHNIILLVIRASTKLAFVRIYKVVFSLVFVSQHCIAPKNSIFLILFTQERFLNAP